MNLSSFDKVCEIFEASSANLIEASKIYIENQ